MIVACRQTAEPLLRLAADGGESHYVQNENCWAEGGFLNRIELAMPRINPINSHYLPHCAVYTLTHAGADYLRGQTGREGVYVERVRERSLQGIAHGLLIHRFYAALRTKIEASEAVQLLDWHGEHSEGARQRLCR